MSGAVSGALQNPTWRLAVVGMLVLVMLVPLALVRGVGAERQRYFVAAATDVAAAWGSSQALAGPFLLVPEIRDSGGQERRMRVILPQSLDVSVDVRHQTRRRGIYQVPVYQAVATFQGTFLLPEAPTGMRRSSDEARLLVGITDPRAVESISELDLAGTATPFAAGTGETWLGDGVHAATTAPGTGVAARFSFQVALRGSGTLSVAPIGSTSGIDMTATWPHPSFSGRFPPSEHEISTRGFTARWLVHELARGLPTSWIRGAQEVNLHDAYAEVSLFQPVTAYTQVERGIKYGVLFIGLTFLAFVCFEMLAGVRFHYVQYAVVGAGLVLFYLALLSLSETLAFALAYVVAALLLCALVTWYVWMITARRRLVAGVCAILIALYACLYVLLELEDYALLVGTGVLFVGLFALMYATSRLDGRMGYSDSSSSASRQASRSSA